MGELQSSLDAYPAWIAIAWCFYPITALVIIKLILSTFDDDDDQDGHGEMTPVFAYSKT